MKSTLIHRPSAMNRILASALLFLVAASALQAEVPLFINYQGRVTDSAGTAIGSGTPVNRKVIFRIWDHPSNTAVGNRLWTEEQTVTIFNGEFSVLIGQGIPFPSGSPEARPNLDTVFGGATTDRFLEILVDNGDNTINGTDQPITPRQQMTSVGYAMRAKLADGVASTNDLQLNASANYGLGWYGTGRLFNATAVDGPVLYGLAGGALGSYNGTTQAMALRWNASGQVGVGSNDLSGADATSKLVLQGNDSTSPPKQLTIRGNTNAKRLYVGYNTSNNYGALQAYNGASTVTNLVLNEAGGNVGIGTTSPRSIFDIAPATATTEGIRVGKWADTASRYIGITDQSAGFTFPTTGGFSGIEFGGPASAAEGILAFHTHDAGVNSGERMRIDKSGNVGIGTTAPAGRLTIGEATGTSPTANTGTLILDHENNAGISSITFRSKTNRGSDFGYISYQDDYLNRAAPNETSSLVIGTGNDTDDHIALLPGGNVGIGTNTPDAKLTIAGVTSWWNGLKITGSGTYAGMSIVNTAAGGNNYSIYATSSGTLEFYNSNGQYPLAMSSGGNVGIGLTSPGDKLHVKGNLRLESAGSANYFQVYVDGFNSLLFKSNLNGGNYAYLNSNTTGLISTSDRRIKKDIAPMQDCLPRIMKLTPSTFRYNTAEPGSPLNYGFIAQDVELQFPDIVQEKEGLKRLASAAFEGINARAIQELKLEKDAEVKGLNDENAELRDENIDLKARVAALEAKDKARDAKLAAIEQLLLAADKPAAQPVSFKKSAGGAE